LSTTSTPPSLEELIEFLRSFAGIPQRQQISAETRLEADLRITGLDGSDLLEASARHFHASLASPDDGYRRPFHLGPDEFLFHAEGLSLGVFLMGLLGYRDPRIRDLTVGELHAAICRTLERPAT